MQHLAMFFQVLQENGLTINPSKCTFAVSSVKFLGHMVDGNGIVPLPRHVQAIQEFAPLADIKQLQQFLGLVNFYRRFLPSAARTLKPLTDLLRGNPKRLEWSPDAQSSFLAAKAALVAAVPLTHPAPGATLALAVDASDTHVGAALQQLECGAWRQLAFFSRKLTVTETRYSTFDRELLAAFAAVRHFRFLLEGRKFRLLTDHKPLVSALARVSPPWSARQQRQLAFLSEFTSDICHTPGTPMWWRMHSRVRRRHSKQPATAPSPKNPPPHSMPPLPNCRYCQQISSKPRHRHPPSTSPPSPPPRPAARMWQPCAVQPLCRRCSGQSTAYSSWEIFRLVCSDLSCPPNFARPPSGHCMMFTTLEYGLRAVWCPPPSAGRT